MRGSFSFYYQYILYTDYIFQITHPSSDTHPSFVPRCSTHHLTVISRHMLLIVINTNSRIVVIKCTHTNIHKKYSFIVSHCHRHHYQHLTALINAGYRGHLHPRQFGKNLHQQHGTGNRAGPLVVYSSLDPLDKVTRTTQSTYPWCVLVCISTSWL